jgi:uncharacterized protein YndB with AHSA1/START domain
MPLKKDGSGKRWIEMEFATPGTPEQVWQALATGPGNAAWFTRATIDERVGGLLRFDFGEAGSSSGEVTAWEPPRRFGYVERDWSPGAPPVATEITIAARAGDECVVRMVHSMFAATDDWDDQLEGFESGWPGFFAVLRIYLSHFAGMPAASFQTLVSLDGDHLELWKRLNSALHLAHGHAGEQATSTQPEPLSGVVEHLEQNERLRFVVIRLDRPSPGIALIGSHRDAKNIYLSVSLYFYGDDAAARASASERRWRAWIAERFTAAAK